MWSLTYLECESSHGRQCVNRESGCVSIKLYLQKPREGPGLVCSHSLMIPDLDSNCLRGISTCKFHSCPRIQCCKTRYVLIYLSVFCKHTTDTQVLGANWGHHHTPDPGSHSQAQILVTFTIWHVAHSSVFSAHRGCVLLIFVTISPSFCLN